MSNEEPKKRNIPYMLYADDDLDDQAFLSEMLRRVNPEIRVNCFVNGLELYKYLENLPQHALLPFCIVLDLNMPIWDGMDTLKTLKDHPIYHSIPTFIFSTSSSEKDMANAESLGVAAYITKPYGQKELFEICQEFAEYSELEARTKDFPISSGR